jgi:hypothetical protein
VGKWFNKELHRNNTMKKKNKTKRMQSGGMANAPAKTGITVNGRNYPNATRLSGTNLNLSRFGDFIRRAKEGRARSGAGSNSAANSNAAASSGASGSARGIKVNGKMYPNATRLAGTRFDASRMFGDRTMAAGGMAKSGAMPVRGGGGVPVQGPGGAVIPSKPARPKGGMMTRPGFKGMPMKKMASGGKVRGGGAATKGLKISKKMG